MSYFILGHDLIDVRFFVHHFFFDLVQRRQAVSFMLSKNSAMGTYQSLVLNADNFKGFFMD
jgi:hypothetical protein